MSVIALGWDGGLFIWNYKMKVFAFYPEWGSGALRLLLAAVLIGGILGLSLANAVFVDEMMMDNTEVLERKVDTLTDEVRRLRDDLKT